MKSAASGRSRRDRAALVGLQRARHRREELAYFLDAGQFLSFNGNFLVFSFFRPHFVDLSDLEFEQLEPLDPVPRRLVKAREIALGAEEIAKEHGGGRRLLPETGERVEELARRVGVEQVSRLRLPVEDEKTRRDLLQRLQSRGRAVHEQPGLAARRDLAPHDDLERAPAAFLEEACLDERTPRLGVVAVERALDDEPLGPRPDGAGPARPPASSITASTTSDFPAPVSPVSTVRPSPNATSTSSRTARSRTRSEVSMDQAALIASRSLLPRFQPVSQPAQREAQPKGGRPDGISA